MISGRLRHSNRRLHKHYDVLETGEVDLGDLASRIRELREKIGDLEDGKLDLETDLGQRREELLRPSAVLTYVNDLKDLLENASLVEQKSFITLLSSG